MILLPIFVFLKMLMIKKNDKYFLINEIYKILLDFNFSLIFKNK